MADVADIVERLSGECSTRLQGNANNAHVIADYMRLALSEAAQAARAERRSALYAQPASDTALREALEPFLTFAEAAIERTEDGWIWKNLSGDRVRDWFGPSDFGLLQHFAALLPAPQDASPAQAYTRTGVKDRDGREICVGDRLRIHLNGPNTKQEYWNPEYEVVFKAPSFGLKHVGGGKDSDTARWHFRTPQPSSTQAIETLSAQDAPSASLAGWRDIATAPKNGTRILGAHCDAAIVVSWCAERTVDAKPGWGDGETDYYGFVYTYPVTHWMPLPPLPASPEQGEAL